MLPGVSQVQLLLVPTTLPNACVVNRVLLNALAQANWKVWGRCDGETMLEGISSGLRCGAAKGPAVSQPDVLHCVDYRCYTRTYFR